MLLVVVTLRFEVGALKHNLVVFFCDLSHVSQSPHQLIVNKFNICRSSGRHIFKIVLFLFDDLIKFFQFIGFTLCQQALFLYNLRIMLKIRIYIHQTYLLNFWYLENLFLFCFEFFNERLMNGHSFLSVFFHSLISCQLYLFRFFTFSFATTILGLSCILRRINFFHLFLLLLLLVLSLSFTKLLPYRVEHTWILTFLILGLILLILFLIFTTHFDKYVLF